MALQKTPGGMKDDNGALIASQSVQRANMTRHLDHAIESDSGSSSSNKRFICASTECMSRRRRRRRRRRRDLFTYFNII